MSDPAALAVRPTLRKLRVADLQAFGAHLTRSACESGRDDDLIFEARELDPRRAAVVIERQPHAWVKQLDQPGWIRTWGLCTGQRVVGHLEAWGGAMPSELHRAGVGLAIERPFRRQGLGRAMVTLVIAWARRRELIWLDLSVFAHNTPAIALYTQLGFVETGRKPDAFRVYGQQVVDVQMALRL